MRRLHINLGVALLTFITAVGADSLLNFIKSKAITQEAVVEHFEWGDDSGRGGAQTPVEANDHEYVFDESGLRIVSEEIHLKSERLRCQIDVRYPQLVGSDDSQVRELNRRIRHLVKSEYEWPLDPSKEELKKYRDRWPSVLNEVEIDYEGFIAYDSLVSIYINVHSSEIEAASTLQFSYAINYDLKLRREVQLSDIFSSDSTYLDFISRYCATELSKRSKSSVTPREYFKSWNITRHGLRINFDKCEVLWCAMGEQSVEIPLAELKPFLASGFRNH